MHHARPRGRASGCIATLVCIRSFLHAYNVCYINVCSHACVQGVKRKVEGPPAGAAPPAKRAAGQKEEDDEDWVDKMVQDEGRMVSGGSGWIRWCGMRGGW